MRIFRLNLKKNIFNKKTIKWLKYAVGEVVLIVVGILLALYINQRGKVKSFNKQKLVYVQTFVNDLKRDLKMLKNYKRLVEKDTLYISTIIKRTKSPEANFDTLLHIYLNEFETKLYTIQGFHDNSLKTMTYSGNNEIFTSRVNNAITELNGLHYEFLSGFNYVFEDFLSFISSLKYQYPVKKLTILNDELLNFVWKEFDKKTIIIEFNNVVLRKQYINNYFLVNINYLISKTENLENVLSQEYLINE